MLAILLSHADQYVSVDTLVAGLWPSRAPASARRNVHLYAHKLRRILGKTTLRSSRDGYALVTGGQVDAAEFGRLTRDAESARSAGDIRVASALFRQALDLWRGDAYAEVRDHEPVAREALRLEHLRLSTYEQWAGTQLSESPSTSFLIELADLVVLHPYHEGLRAHLMRALALAGRPAEALTTFTEARQLFREELGVEPGPALCRLHEAILRGEDVRSGTDLPPRPAQLPANIVGFAGRAGEIARLDALLAESVERPVTVVLSGVAGVGKSALAVHWAHRASEAFPDGQLYIDLRGFDPGGPPVRTAEAIAQVIDAVVVRPTRIPASLSGRAGLLRTLLADRKVLIVLDNARSADQVRPLLPASRGCLALVTSRVAMNGLVASDGAHPIPLDVIDAPAARQMLASRLGPERIANEPQAVDDIIGRCGGLPLALSVIAANAATQGIPLSALAKDLRGVEDRLDALDSRDSATDVRAAFSLSYRELSPEAARLFRLWSQHPGADLTPPAAASLVAQPVTVTKVLLAELAAMHLITQRVAGRFSMHDLVRAFAAEMCHAVDALAERRAAKIRMVDHFLHSAHRAVMTVYPHRNPIALPPSAPGIVITPPVDLEEAIQWFAAEHLALLSAVDDAAGQELGARVWQLAWCLETYLDRRGHWDQQADVFRTALAAALATNDLAGQAHSHHGLATAHTWLNQYEVAEDHYDKSQRLFEDLGDDTGQAHSLLNQALLSEQQNRLPDALDRATRSLELFDAIGHGSGLAKALNAVGWYEALLGEYGAARAHCEHALELLEELGDQYTEALTWDSLGYIHYELASYPDAVRCYESALGLFRRLYDRYLTVSILHRLGDAHQAMGDGDQAREAWQEAADLHREVPHPDGVDVIDKLARIKG